MRASSLLLAVLAVCPIVHAEEAATRPAVPAFRTDSQNADLPWYQLKPGEFPPIGAAHLVTGELLEADYIHRGGQFRDGATGELVDFKLLPCGVVCYLNAGADLRDVPLGTSLQFSLFKDEAGAFTQAADVRDDFSLLSAGGSVYRLDEAHLDGGKLNVTRQKTADAQPNGDHQELKVNDQTRVWKGNQQIKLADLAAGDLLLVNLAGCAHENDVVCRDVWVSADGQKLATAQQRKRHIDFLKERGLAAWIDRVEGKRIAVTFFGEPDDLQALFKAEGINSAQWVKDHRRVHTVAANSDLRTYNPPVDGQGSNVLEFSQVPATGYGCSGVQWLIEPNLMLEGFRKGHVVRVYAQPSWQVHDMPFGESVYTETPNAKTEEESPNQYPFRTDFGNGDLPWYQIKAGEFPPYQSDHQIAGELLKMDAEQRRGRFRADITGELIDFTLPPFGEILYHTAGAEPADVPLGAHYYFHLHQDDKGAFTRAALITDDFTYAVNDRVTLRIDEINPANGKLLLSRKLAPMKDERDHLVQPPDLSHGEFAFNDRTRIWKGGAPAKPGDLAVGDELLVNLTGRTKTSRGVCKEIWAGAETLKKAADQQRAKHAEQMKTAGLLAWIDKVDGKEVTITFFAANRRDFPSILGDDPWGKPVMIAAVDDQLHPLEGEPAKFNFKNHLPEGNTAGTFGCSGVRWVLESQQSPTPWKQGHIIRLWKEGWPAKSATK